MHSPLFTPRITKRLSLLMLIALVSSSLQSVSAKQKKFSVKSEIAQQRYIVQFHNPLASSTKVSQAISLQEAKDYINTVGGNIVQELPKNHAVAAYLSAHLYKQLQRDERVKLIERDPIRTLQSHPSQALSAPQSNALEISPYGLAAIQADGSYSDTSETQKVCVIDTGYDLQHNDLMQGSNVTGEVVASFDSKGTPVNLGEWSTDSYGQGTHVAGTLSALGDNGLGIRGVAAKGVMPVHHVKVIHKANYWAMWGSDMIAALEKCQQSGAKIINISLSGQSSSQIEAEAFANAWDSGVMVFAAAGNRGDSTSFYPASYSEVISVGATTEGNNAWSFTQRNNDIELVAPGAQVYSTFPNNQYRAWDGTGVAVPYVTAVAALAWGENPECSASTLREILQQSALDLGDAGRDNTFGFGLVQLQNTLNTISNTNCQAAPAAPIFDHVVQVDANSTVDIPFVSSTINVQPQHGELEQASLGLRYVPSLDFNGFDYFTTLDTNGEEKVVQVQIGQPAESTFFIPKELGSTKILYDQGTLLVTNSQYLRRLSVSGEVLQGPLALAKQAFHLAILSSGDILTIGSSGSYGVSLTTYDKNTLELKQQADVSQGNARITQTSYKIIPHTSGGFTLFWAEPNFIKGRHFNANLEPTTEAISVAGNPDASDKFWLNSNEVIAVEPSSTNEFLIAYPYRDPSTKQYMLGIHKLSSDLKSSTSLAKWSTTRLASRVSLTTNLAGDLLVGLVFEGIPYLGIINSDSGQLPLQHAEQSLGASFFYFHVSTINDKWLVRWNSNVLGRFIKRSTKAVLIDNHGNKLIEPIVVSRDTPFSGPATTTDGRIAEIGGYSTINYTLKWYTPETWLSTSILKASNADQSVINQSAINTHNGNDFIQNVANVDSGSGRDYIINGQQINAGTGHDRIEMLTAQTRIIDGGEGFDTLVLNGEKSDFQLLNNHDGSFQLTDLRDDENLGNNQLKNIEAIEFRSSQQLLQPNLTAISTLQWELPLNTQMPLPNIESIVLSPTKGSLNWVDNQWHYRSSNTSGSDSILFTDSLGNLHHLEIHVATPNAHQHLIQESGSKSRIVAGNNQEVFLAWNKIAERKRYFVRLDNQQTQLYKGGVSVSSSYTNQDLRPDIAVLNNGIYGVIFNYGKQHYPLHYSDSNRAFTNNGVHSSSSSLLFTGLIARRANDSLVNLTHNTSSNSSIQTSLTTRYIRFDEHVFEPNASTVKTPPLQTSLPSVTGLANGSLLVASAYENQIQFHFSTEVGRQLSDSRIASTNPVIPSDEVHNVATAAQADGSFVIAWTQTGDIDGDGESIAMRYFAEDGTPITESLTVNQTTEGNQRGVRLTTLEDGRVAVVWYSETGDGDGNASFIRWFDNKGIAQSDEQMIIADTIGDQRDPDITTLSDNRVMVSLTNRGEITKVFVSASSNGDDIFYSYQPELDANSLANLTTDGLYYGNNGNDSVFYPGNSADYTINNLSSGEKQVIKPNGSIDRLFSIENIGFY